MTSVGGLVVGFLDELIALVWSTSLIVSRSSLASINKRKFSALVFIFMPPSNVFHILEIFEKNPFSNTDTLVAI
jgi:hypothetical protein